MVVGATPHHRALELGPSPPPSRTFWHVVCGACWQSDEGVDAAALRELEEMRFLMTFCKDAKHFAVQAVLGSGACGIVFAVKCTHVDFPFPDKVPWCM